MTPRPQASADPLNEAHDRDLHAHSMCGALGCGHHEGPLYRAWHEFGGGHRVAQIRCELHRRLCPDDVEWEPVDDGRAA